MIIITKSTNFLLSLRTCDVSATFPWRISDVFVWNFTFVCKAIKAFELRTCDVYMAYEVYA